VLFMLWALSLLVIREWLQEEVCEGLLFGFLEVVALHQCLNVAPVPEELAEDLCLQVVNEIVGMVKLVIHVLCETTPLKNQLYASVELLRGDLFKSVELRASIVFCLLCKSCSLKKRLERIDHVALVLA